MSSGQMFDFTAKTFYGLENVLADELKLLGASNVRTANRAVNFSGDTEIMYRANFHLRTAISILKPIVEFKAKSEEELYTKVQETDWTQLLSLKHTFAVEPTVYSTIFRHSQYAALKTKDAIVDQFRAKTGKRPFIDLDNPQVRINLHISETDCTLSLNSSGDPLFKRGYRVAAPEAPISEVMAAGLIALSGWKPTQHFVDFMCGSGTLLIEAALIANNIPPGIFRKEFGFENWPDFDKDLFEKITSEDEHELYDKNLNGLIMGCDISSRAISMAKNNIKNAFLHNAIDLEISDFKDYDPDVESGVVIINPPYGERLVKEDIDNFYKEIGNTLKQRYKNFDAWIISSNIDAIKQVGLHPTRKIKMLNASLECTFNKYSIYEGSMKASKNTPSGSEE